MGDPAEDDSAAEAPRPLRTASYVETVATAPAIVPEELNRRPPSAEAPRSPGGDSVASADNDVFLAAAREIDQIEERLEAPRVSVGKQRSTLGSVTSIRNMNLFYQAQKDDDAGGAMTSLTNRNRKWQWADAWLAMAACFSSSKAKPMGAPPAHKPALAVRATESFPIFINLVYLALVLLYIVNDERVEGPTEYYEEEHCRNWHAFWSQPRNDDIELAQLGLVIVAFMHTLMRYFTMFTEPTELRARGTTFATVMRAAAWDERVWIDVAMLCITLMPQFDHEEYDDLWTPTFLYIFSWKAAFKEVILLYLAYMPKDEHIVGIILKTYKLLSTFLCGLAAVVFLVDRCGLNSSWGDETNLFEALWFTLTTLTTVGYGDLVPANWQGQCVVLLMFIYIMVVLPDLLNELNSSREQYSHLGRTYVHQIGHPHVVIVGGKIGADKLEDFLVDFFASATRKYSLSRTNVVILSPFQKSDDPKVVVNWPKYKNRLFYLQGTALEESDLLRARVKDASAVFILADHSCRSAREADGQTILRSWAISEHSSSCLQYVQVFLPESKYHLATLPTVMPLCLSELRLSVLSSSCEVRGFSTIIATLLFDLTESDHTGVTERQLKRAYEDLAELDERHAKSGLGYIRQEVDLELQHAPKHYYLFRKRVERQMQEERERAQAALETTQNEDFLAALADAADNSDEDGDDAGDGVRSGKPPPPKPQRRATIAPLGAGAPAGGDAKAPVVSRPDRRSVTPAFPAAVESTPYLDFVARVFAHAAGSPEQLQIGNDVVVDGVPFPELFGLVRKRKLATLRWQRDNNPELSHRRARSPASPLGGLGGASKGDGKGDGDDDDDDGWSDSAIEKRAVQQTASALWDNMMPNQREGLGRGYAVYRETVGEADEAYTRRLQALRVQTLEDNLAFSAQCVNELTQVSFSECLSGGKTAAEHRHSQSWLRCTKSARIGGFHGGVLYHCGDTVVHPGASFRLSGADTIFFVGHRDGAVPNVTTTTFAEVYLEMLGQGCTLVAVRLGCTCSTLAYADTYAPQSPKALERHGTGLCTKHSDMCELALDPYEAGGTDEVVAVEASRCKIGPLREHYLYRGSPAVYTWRRDADYGRPMLALSKVSEVHRLHGANVIDLTVGSIPELNASYVVAQMMRQLRQVRTGPLNSVEVFKPIVFVLGRNPAKDSKLVETLSMGPAMYYAVGDFQRYHEIPNLVPVLERASVIMIMANGNEFGSSDGSTEDGMSDASAIRVAHDLQVEFPDAHVVTELAHSKNHRYLRQQLPLRQLVRSNRMTDADRRAHPHFMFSVPCQNGSVFCGTLANMLCYKLYHLAHRRAAMYGVEGELAQRKLGRHTESESSYMSVVLQLLGLTANIKRPPGQGTTVFGGTVPLGAIRPPPPPPTAFPYGSIREVHFGVALVRECHLVEGELAFHADDPQLGNPDVRVDWLVSAMSRSVPNESALLSDNDVTDIFSGDPKRRPYAFHRALCEKKISRAMVHFREASRRVEKRPQPLGEVLFSFQDGDRLRHVSLHAAMAILLMPVDFGVVAKTMVVRDEAVLLGFYRTGKSLLSIPRDAVHEFLTETDPKLLDPGRHEGKATVDHASVLFNPSVEEPVRLGDTLYAIFPAQLCHKPQHALGRYAP